MITDGAIKRSVRAGSAKHASPTENSSDPVSDKPAPGSQNRIAEYASWISRQAIKGSLGWDSSMEFDEAKYVKAVGESTLKPKEKATIVDMLCFASDRGVTTVDRASLAKLASVSRVATISARWERIREQGFLNSRQRMDKSSVHVFTLPPPPGSQPRTEGGDAAKSPGSASFIDLGVRGLPGSSSVPDSP